MKYKAIILYPTDHFKLVKKDEDTSLDSFRKYLDTPYNEDVESCFVEVYKNIGDGYFILRNSSSLGVHKIRNQRATILAKEDMYWNCAIIKAKDSNKPLYDIELDYMTEEDVENILKRST